MSSTDLKGNKNSVRISHERCVCDEKESPCFSRPTQTTKKYTFDALPPPPPPPSPPRAATYVRYTVYSISFLFLLSFYYTPCARRSFHASSHDARTSAAAAAASADWPRAADQYAASAASRISSCASSEYG